MLLYISLPVVSVSLSACATVLQITFIYQLIQCVFLHIFFSQYQWPSLDGEPMSAFQYATLRPPLVLVTSLRLLAPPQWRKQTFQPSALPKQFLGHCFSFTIPIANDKMTFEM